MRVQIVERRRGRETVVAVQSERSGAVLHASVGINTQGAALALVEAVSYCATRRHVIVSPSGAAARVREVA